MAHHVEAQHIGGIERDDGRASGADGLRQNLPRARLEQHAIVAAHRRTAGPGPRGRAGARLAWWYRCVKASAPSAARATPPNTKRKACSSARRQGPAPSHKVADALQPAGKRKTPPANCHGQVGVSRHRVHRARTRQHAQRNATPMVGAKNSPAVAITAPAPPSSMVGLVPSWRIHRPAGTSPSSMPSASPPSSSPMTA